MIADVSRQSSSGDRMLAVLGLFSIDRPQWTVEAAADDLGVSATTAYRYFKRLTQCRAGQPGVAGELRPRARHRADGPADSDFRSDAARSRAASFDLIQYAPEGSALLLCRLFHDRVDVRASGGRSRSAAAGELRARTADSAFSRSYLENHPRAPAGAHAEVAVHAERGDDRQSGLGRTWDEFRQRLAAFRRAGAAVTRGEIDPGRVGIAAPIFEGRAILGSLSFVLPADRADDDLIGRLAPLTIAGAREIERAMALEAVVPASPARVRVAR